MSIKRLIPCIYLKENKLVKGFKDNTILSDEVTAYVTDLAGCGADELLIFDLSENDAEHESHILLIRELCRNIDIPAVAAGNIARLEDVKKVLYAGCSAVALNMAKQSNIDLIEEAGKRFGKNKLLACVDAQEQILNNLSELKEYVSGIVLLGHDISENYASFSFLPVLNAPEDEIAKNLLKQSCVMGLTGDYINAHKDSLMQLKSELKKNGVEVNRFESSLSFDDLKLNSDGHVTVVVQDYRTDEVLMVAYMNREAFETTIRTGKMTYYSRSRQQLWIKGETSGHFQYVRSLYADCDHDTLLAKVHQIGAACHTGNRSCFFEEIMHTDYLNRNPLKVFEDVFNVILDR
ncbi:MAG: phosphoribosyl-AMP cyclohydrolase, partial [Lachnospiraceae bacterium]|nr:phosphoribosyl-AMP cyclohydrolase [Lachnospiraceae bacterium]